MKNGTHKQDLEILWRREPPADGRSRLERQMAGSVEDRQLFEEEVALSRVLHGISDAPLSSNFTARVVAAVRLESARSARADYASGMVSSLSRLRAFFSRSWASRTAAAALAAAIGLTAFYGVKSYQRQQLIQTLATVTQVKAMPEIDVLQDFDAIRHLGRVQASKTTMEMDAALLAALQ